MQFWLSAWVWVTTTSCFSNLDLYLTMCEEIYDESSVKGGGRRSWSPSSRSCLKWWRAHLQRLSQSANQPSIFIRHVKSARDRSIKDRITKQGSLCRSKWFLLCNGVCPVRCKSSTKLRLTGCLVETPAPLILLPGDWASRRLFWGKVEIGNSC